MKAKLVAEGTTVTYVVVLDQGEEAFSTLTDWAASEGISAAQVTAVGAFERVGPGRLSRVGPFKQLKRG